MPKIPNDIESFKSAALSAAQTAIGYGTTSQLVKDRAAALDYYYQRPFGNEVKGQSQVVTSDVADTIEWIMPSLMRIFASSGDLGKFEPQGQEDEQGAKQATDYVNHVIMVENHGFLKLHAWFKDALLQKNGIAKVWWDASQDVNPEIYIGLTDQEFAFVVNDPEVEIAQHDAEPDADMAQQMAQMGIQPGIQMPMPMVHNVKVVRRKDTGKCRWEVIPPEEFLISADARTIDDATWVGHRSMRTRSDLIDEGYPREIVEKLPTGSDRIGQEDRVARARNSTGNSLIPYVDPTGGYAERVEVIEGYFRYDLDGDGIDELRQVTIAGNQLLQKPGEDPAPQTDIAPFADLTPIPMSHTWVGRSVADQVMDIQLIRSTVLRNAMTNLYQANNSRMWAVKGQVELDDLLTPRPGGVVRVTSPTAVGQIQSTAMLGEALEMIAYLDSARENRTGVTRYNQGLDANTLNKTATGISLIQGASTQRIELIARVFAETGVKRLFRLVLRCVSKYQSRQKIVRMQNKWTPVDPRMWNNEMDATVQVGVGTGNREQTLASVSNVMAVMEKIIQLQQGMEGPFVFPSHVHNLLSRFVEASGFKSPDLFFADPQGQPPVQKAPPQPSPDAVLKAQVEMKQIESNETIAMMKTAVDGKKVQLEYEKAHSEAFLTGRGAALEHADRQTSNLIAAAKVKQDGENARRQAAE